MGRMKTCLIIKKVNSLTSITACDMGKTKSLLLLLAISSWILRYKIIKLLLENDNLK